MKINFEKICITVCSALLLLRCQSATVNLAREEIRNLILETESTRGLCLNARDGIRLVLSASLDGERVSTRSDSRRHLRFEDFHLTTNYGQITATGHLQPPDNPVPEDLKKDIVVKAVSRFNSSIASDVVIRSNFSCNASLDFSGKKGRAGVDGERGRDGERGQPGRNGADGEDASSVEVSFRELEAFNLLEVSIRSSSGIRKVFLDNSGNYQLVLNAGGGAGGGGGGGGGGGTGRAARNEFFGTPQGGAGGDGGNGGNGGRGADVAIRYDKKSAWVRNRLAVSNKGGVPGAAGEGGFAGSGGMGGESEFLSGANTTCSCLASIPMMMLGLDRGYKSRKYFDSRGNQGISGRVGMNGSAGRAGTDGQIKELPF